MIVKVQFVKGTDELGNEIYGGREYYYFCDNDVAVGDILEVDRNGNKVKVQASEINVSGTEIMEFRDNVKWAEKFADMG